METFGKLTFKIYITLTQDEHGRDRGAWRTLSTQWLENDRVPQAIERFYELNQHIQHQRIEVAFTTTTHYPC